MSAVDPECAPPGEGKPSGLSPRHQGCFGLRRLRKCLRTPRRRRRRRRMGVDVSVGDAHLTLTPTALPFFRCGLLISTIPAFPCRRAHSWASWGVKADVRLLSWARGRSSDSMPPRRPPAVCYSSLTRPESLFSSY
ncbi:hypothetical protein K504DRAFT_91461 [Pleomassaria siparia CBS 279.74]|uniref:Uncharacterized protein n=1 Tax=Pleomassaria siparia CBS 279.74 TaxID=1314801 RepID=A0A6G1JXZ3_9PLEO|nr:hypothetical protein K504DRAFT_91461 [Pleomassaria siparia CBS 279.74]